MQTLAHRKCLLVQTWLWGLNSDMSELARVSWPFQLQPADHVIAVICSQGDKGGNIPGTSFPSGALTAEKTRALPFHSWVKAQTSAPAQTQAAWDLGAICQT